MRDPIYKHDGYIYTTARLAIRRAEKRPWRGQRVTNYREDERERIAKGESRPKERRTPGSLVVARENNKNRAKSSHFSHPYA